MHTAILPDSHILSEKTEKYMDRKGVPQRQWLQVQWAGTT